MTALQTNATPKFTDVENLNRPELLSKKELLTTVEMAYEATQGLFAHGGPTELSNLLEDAFTAYVQSDDFLKRNPTPDNQAAALSQIFQIKRFLGQMYAVDNRVFKKAKKRFSKEVEKPV
jgi:hypothetical protein